MFSLAQRHALLHAALLISTSVAQFSISIPDIFGLQPTSTSVAQSSASNNVGSDGAQPTVTLSQGVYVGSTTQLPTATPINVFLGIPFSDKLERFDPPRDPPSSDAVVQANFHAPSCYQQFNYPDAQRAFLQYV